MRLRTLTVDWATVIKEGHMPHEVAIDEGIAISAISAESRFRRKPDSPITEDESSSARAREESEDEAQRTRLSRKSFAHHAGHQAAGRRALPHTRRAPR